MNQSQTSTRDKFRFGEVFPVHFTGCWGGSWEQRYVVLKYFHGEFCSRLLNDVGKIKPALISRYYKHLYVIWVTGIVLYLNVNFLASKLSTLVILPKQSWTPLLIILFIYELLFLSIKFICPLLGVAMSRQSSGKTLLRNVIRHTDAHNKVNSVKLLFGLLDKSYYAFVYFVSSPVIATAFCQLCGENFHSLCLPLH